MTHYDELRMFTEDKTEENDVFIPFILNRRLVCESMAFADNNNIKHQRNTYRKNRTIY